MAEIITACLKCAHEFCPNCGVVLLYTRKAGITTCEMQGLQCCKCKEKINSESYIVVEQPYGKTYKPHMEQKEFNYGATEIGQPEGEK